MRVGRGSQRQQRQGQRSRAQKARRRQSRGPAQQEQRAPGEEREEKLHAVAAAASERGRNQALSTFHEPHDAGKSPERPGWRPRNIFWFSRRGLVLREHFMAAGTRVRVEEVPELLVTLWTSGSVHIDDCCLRAWLFSELFPDIGFQIIKERIPVKIYRS